MGHLLQLGCWFCEELVKKLMFILADMDHEGTATSYLKSVINRCAVRLRHISYGPWTCSPNAEMVPRIPDLAVRNSSLQIPELSDHSSAQVTLLAQPWLLRFYSPSLKFMDWIVTQCYEKKRCLQFQSRYKSQLQLSLGNAVTQHTPLRF